MKKEPKKHLVKSQAGLAKFLSSSTQNEFVDHHGTRCGSSITITRGGKLLTKSWNTYYTGEVEESTLKEMLDFINQE